ncbi:DUF689-domain-containing protein [Exidia glandulosa HHB12029]|uniref:DUF689-domain-containing protein n=1 Tax=Exidia glandulosa HHB12029 TaxID=1314781 RepID=A0A166BUA7_EXIGL|nr:DUF689-domain-containing protein [Exidia glandulosa HHB12029]
MSPTALDYTPAATPASKGDALVIGSLATAADGSYQELINSLSGRNVERQLVDRILDQAVTLEKERFSSAYVVLGADEYASLRPRLPNLLSAILSALKPLGTVHIRNLVDSPELATSGFSLLTTTGELVAQKPAGAAKSVPLPRRAGGPAKKKQMLWALSAPSTPPVDAEQLLTETDRARPAPCEPFDATTGAPRRKKACKNCSCGLAEIEAEEERNAVKVVLDAAADADSVRRPAPGAAPKVTSSCGSCYLGDAFRCASCPYLGLPAFEPGQKVELVGMSDDI